VPWTSSCWEPDRVYPWASMMPNLLRLVLAPNQKLLNKKIASPRVYPAQVIEVPR
jgi:hypothetical protein